MTRRAFTTFLAALLALGLALAGGWQTVPYVILSPGPAYNTLGSVGGTPVLTITGRESFPTDGSLDLTTVNVSDGVTLFEALGGWLSKEEVVLPRELVYPPGSTEEETDKENRKDFTESQADATIAALNELGIPGTSRVVIQEVSKGKPADGVLKAGDYVTMIDGVAVKDLTGLRALISKHAPGESVVVSYLRDGKGGTATLATVASDGDSPVRAVIGISGANTTTFPVTVKISLEQVGGPSAGLMFALGIIDKLQRGSLTGGRIIAGTGEITPDGTVGPIGGIGQKLLGAVHAKATDFLVPAGNCAEAAKRKPDGLRLIKVATLKDALSALATMRTGGTPPTC